MHISSFTKINSFLFGHTFHSLFLFSKMPYFREMAQKLSIDLPKLNEEIQIKGSQKCLVYGIKQIPPQEFLDQSSKATQKQNKLKFFDSQTLVGFEIDKNSRQLIQFSLVKKIAESLQFDVCLIKQNSLPEAENRQLEKQQQSEEQQANIILSLTKFRQYIYREYYLKELKTKSRQNYIQTELINELNFEQSHFGPKSVGAVKNRIKSIRIGQQVHAHDIKNKQNQIDRWLQQGQRTIKVIAHNNSEKSHKALEKFAALYQKECQIIEQKIQPNLKKKPILRLYTILQFEQQIDIDFDFINRRWRRRQTELRRNKLNKKGASDLFDVNLTNQEPQIQKMYLNAFQQAGIPYPRHYDYLTKIQKDLDDEGIMGLVRSVDKEIKLKKQQQSIDQFEGQDLTEKQKEIRDKEMRKIMGIRTLQDIIQQMEELRNRQYEMEMYERTRYKELEKQLKHMLQNSELKNKSTSYVD